MFVNKMQITSDAVAHIMFMYRKYTQMITDTTKTRET